LNWSWTTLAAVMDGRTPRGKLEVVVRRPDPRLFELDLVNTGEAECDTAASVTASWPGAALVAADALNGLEFDSSSPGRVLFRPVPGSEPARIAPGQRRPIGWLRLDADTEVATDVVPPQG
jgi:hypothetical protein